MLPVRTRCALVVAIGLAVGVASPAFGAQAPSDVDCALPAVAIPLFEATPAAIVAASPVAFDPVADLDEAEIEAAAAGFIACINTGDPALQYAIFTERYLGEQLADPTEVYQPEFEQQLAQGAIDEPAQFVLIEVSSVELRADGSVSVTITYNNGISEFRDTLVLVRIDGVWLIDSIEQLDPER